MSGKVSIGIVTFNSRQFLSRCLESVFSQTHAAAEVIVVDNHSTDGSAVWVRKNYPQVRVIENAENTGFSYAQNQAIATSGGEFYLSLNADAVLTPTCVEQLVAAMALDEHIGIVTGKIYRLDGKMIDSTGICWTKNLRHLDRGSGEIDNGQYEKMEYVFGATGAVCLMRRTMLEDVKIGREYVDNDFFFGREDADLCWRAQIAGWKVLYTPRAIAYHLRNVLPERRSTLSSLVNMHGAKNRFLLQIKNHTAGTWLATFPDAQVRDIGVIVYVLTRERTSLPGLFFVLKHLGRFLGKRKLIMKQRRVKDGYLRRWFH